MNQTKCKDCAHFDPQHKYVNGKKVALWYGICAKQSLYPDKERDGQIFPEDAQRVDHGELAKPTIVTSDGVQHRCLLVLPKAR